MNLRNKFIWNMLIGIAFISIIWYSWNIYNVNYDTKIFLKNFHDEQVGTDKSLQNKVTELEEIYTYRENLKFKIQENPFDLSRVLTDGSGSGRRSKIWV